MEQDHDFRLPSVLGSWFPPEPKEESETSHGPHHLGVCSTELTSLVANCNQV